MTRVWIRLATGCFGVLVLSPTVQASCAQLKISGAKDCANLKVDADLSRCEPVGEVTPPVVECQGEKASIQIKTGLRLFQATAVLGPEQWGNRSWAQDGALAETKVVAPGNVVSAVKHGKGSDSKKMKEPKGHSVSSSSKPNNTAVLTSAHPPVQGQPLVAVPAAAPAQATAVIEPGKTEAAVAPAANAWLTGLTISGTIDMYYSYNSNNPKPVPPPPPSPANANSSYHGVDNTQTPFRNFDSRHNTMALNLAELSVKKVIDEMILRLDFDFGDMADLTHRDANNTVDETTKHVGQAIITWAPKAAPGLSINVGKMATHMGYETTKAKDNWQYSRSFIYALAIPYWHTGASIVYAPSELYSAALFVYNGWNSTTEVNSGKTLGLQLVVTPVSGFSITYNGIGGAERPADDKDKLVVHEGIIAWTINPQWSTALDYVNGSYQHNPVGTTVTGRWQGATLAVKFAPTAKYYISPRIESYWDHDGVTTGTVQVLHEATLTNSYLLSEGLETRFELRSDQSNHTPFVKDGSAKKSQSNATIGLLASF